MRRIRRPIILACLGLSSLLPISLSTDSARAQGAERTDDAPESPEQTHEPVWLGVVLHSDSDESSTATVEEIVDNSPADRAGLRPGDRLTHVADNEVDNFASLRAALDGTHPGENVTVEYRREGADRSASVTLSLRPDDEVLLEQQLTGQQLPSGIELEPVDGGESFSTGALDGRPLVLEFWATWCTPCRRTAKRLTSLEEDFGERLRIVAASGEERSVVDQFLEEHPRPYSVAIDAERTLHRALYVSRLPTVVIVNGDGEITDVFAGADHASELRHSVRRLLD